LTSEVNRIEFDWNESDEDSPENIRSQEDEASGFQPGERCSSYGLKTQSPVISENMLIDETDELKAGERLEVGTLKSDN
jgi:hypothetical protein